VPHVTAAKLEQLVTTTFGRVLKAQATKLAGAAKEAKPISTRSKKDKEEGDDVGGNVAGNDDGDAGSADEGKPAAKRRKVANVKGARDSMENEEAVEAEEDAEDAGGNDDESVKSGMYSSDDLDELDQKDAMEEDDDEEVPEGGADGADGKKKSVEEEAAAANQDEVAKPEESAPSSSSKSKKKEGKTQTSIYSVGTMERDMEDVAKAGWPRVWAGDLVGERQAVVLCMRHSESPLRLLLPEVITEICGNLTLQDEDAKGVKKVHVEEDKGKVRLKCEGVNLHALHVMPEGTVAHDRISTNDIRKIFESYGCEAARAVLVQEVKAVFGHYGIDVNHRHLSLISDYMTRNGGLVAFSRHGMDKCASPIQQMSYETTMNYMSQAATENLKDSVKSPASSIVMGQPPVVGTGMISLLVDLHPPVGKSKHNFTFS